MGLSSTGSVFVAVLKPLGVLQSNWLEGGAAVRQWVILAASEERQCQNRTKWALPLRDNTHFCQRAPLRRPGVFCQDSSVSPRVGRDHIQYGTLPKVNMVSPEVAVAHDLQLYSPHPMLLLVLSCYLRQFECPAFLFSCQLWRTPAVETWAMHWSVWLRLTLSLPSPLKSFKAKAIRKQFCKYLIPPSG